MAKTCSMRRKPKDTEEELIARGFVLAAIEAGWDKTDFTTLAASRYTLALIRAYLRDEAKIEPANRNDIIQALTMR